ncbi:hypothetical protein PILCRDRAFT_824072 [Piloderma croceum F 1598]|uniref:DUF1279 domain-containing protein n=1 Tax=Piloderma croceum (strain F 1598) TaxID=765440 RepID=A0A0C3BNP7_PILCF|nr:hypothetical protein PILCRDRAFT_824072 [Piloderma croceum F 1598]
MIRRFLPRLRLFKSFNPIRSSPILPLASRIGLRSTSPTSLTRSPRPPNSRLFSHFSARLTQSPPRSPLDDRPLLPENASLSQRLKHLIKSYGWYALGIYLVITVVDFGVVFACINLIGAEHVSRLTASVKQYVSGFVYNRPAEPGREETESASGHGGSHEDLYAMIVLAYTIHKTLLLPVRVGLTAALTPKFVAWLGHRGWAGGAGTRRAANEMRERLRTRRNQGE